MYFIYLKYYKKEEYTSCTKEEDEVTSKLNVLI